jgi:hypothetical protein
MPGAAGRVRMHEGAYAGGNFVTAGGDPRANFAAVARARAGAPQVYLPLITR